MGMQRTLSCTESIDENGEDEIDEEVLDDVVKAGILTPDEVVINNNSVKEDTEPCKKLKTNCYEFCWFWWSLHLFQLAFSILELRFLMICIVHISDINI